MTFGHAGCVGPRALRARSRDGGRHLYRPEGSAPGPEALRARLARFGLRGDDESARVDALQGRRLQVPAGTQLVHEGQVERCGYVLLSGWASSSVLLRDGRRQVIDLHLPGDLVGVSQMLLPVANLSHDAVTDIEIAKIGRAALMELVSGDNKVGGALLQALAEDEARLASRLTDVGRRSPQVRTARCLLELARRAEDGDPLRVHCPMSQYVIADMLGLSAVHLNRVLRQLREAGLVSFRDAVIDIHDLDGLRAFSEIG